MLGGWSPSSRGRGLKFKFWKTKFLDLQSPSSRGRGLKSFLQLVMICVCLSPSSRGRGLKYAVSAEAENLKESRPLHEGVD